MCSHSLRGAETPPTGEVTPTGSRPQSPAVEHAFFEYRDEREILHVS